MWCGKSSKGKSQPYDAVEIVVVSGAEHDLMLSDGTLAREYERRLVDRLVARSSG